MAFALAAPLKKVIAPGGGEDLDEPCVDGICSAVPFAAASQLTVSAGDTFSTAARAPAATPEAKRVMTRLALASACSRRTETRSFAPACSVLSRCITCSGSLLCAAPGFMPLACTAASDSEMPPEACAGSLCTPG